MTALQIIIPVIVALISILGTYFVTTASQKNNLKGLLNEHLLLKETEQHHYTLQIMQEHVTNCMANKKIDKIERALIYIVTQLGGNPKDVGLL